MALVDSMGRRSTVAVAMTAIEVQIAVSSLRMGAQALVHVVVEATRGAALPRRMSGKY